MLSFGFHRSPLLCAFARLCILCFLLGLCWYLWPFACFCKNLMFNISFGCCRHSVSNTFVQLTEGRSARDQPKQPPAKKMKPSTLKRALRGFQGGFKGCCRYTPCSKCYGMNCFATYFTHVQTCNVTLVQSATEWTASVTYFTHAQTCNVTRVQSATECIL